MSTFYPRFYTVNDRPVKLQTLPSGELEVLVVDPVTGMLVRDMSYLSRTAEHGIGKDVDALTEAEFEARRIALKEAASQRRHNRPILWSNTGDGEFPYRTELDGYTLIVRVNSFPAESLYTLLINNVEVEDLEHWPKAWVRPGRPRSGAW